MLKGRCDGVRVSVHVRNGIIEIGVIHTHRERTYLSAYLILRILLAAFLGKPSL